MRIMRLVPACDFPVTEEIHGKSERVRHLSVQALMEALAEGLCESLRRLLLRSVRLDRFFQQTFRRLA